MDKANEAKLLREIFGMKAREPKDTSGLKIRIEEYNEAENARRQAEIEAHLERAFNAMHIMQDELEALKYRISTLS